MATNPALTPAQWHPVVERLQVLLQGDPELKQQLLQAIEVAGRFDPPYLDSYCYLVHRMQTTIPNPRTWLPMNLEFYYVLNCSQQRCLVSHPDFMHWVRDYVSSIGSWMDSPDSMQQFSQFIDEPLYAVEDYIAPPGGWLTYNQFFARQIRPGCRPIAEPHDDSVIVSAADSTFCGAHRIGPESTIELKGLRWSIEELLSQSPYANEFVNGFYGHSFLAPHNYHRFHAPVSGKLLELRTVMGRVTMDVHQEPDGSLCVSRSAIGYQFQQERGLAIFDSPVGLVAVLPIGMGIVSSVTFSAKPGSHLAKGDELGFFSFGGSDVVLLFQADARLSWLLNEGGFIHQGQPYATITS